MKKHPNAPPGRKTDRKDQVKVSLQEYEEINKLWEGGMKQKDIAALKDRSTGTICYIINRTQRARLVKRMNKKDIVYINKTEYHELEEMDLSKLPDTVLFQHSKEYYI
jgi:hypothetical protein